MPREFGLIGRTLSYSFSPTYFSQKFDRLGLTDCTYESFELPDIRELPALLNSRPHLAGLNVTIPYKEQVLPYLHDVSPAAARIGAVNTIQFDSGRLIGHNTDYTGFRDSVSRFCPNCLPDTSALILGTGGAAKAVEVVLRDLGIRSWFVSRDPLGSGFSYADLTPQLLQRHKLIVNTTPLGTYPQVQAFPDIPYQALTPAHFLFDLIYNPSETEFLRRGREQGAHTQNGFEMLCLQAEAAWEIWNRER